MESAWRDRCSGRALGASRRPIPVTHFEYVQLEALSQDTEETEARRDVARGFLTRVVVIEPTEEVEHISGPLTRVIGQLVDGVHGGEDS